MVAVDLLVVDTEHDGDGGTVDIGIDEAHFGAGLRKRDSEVDSHGALAHAAFAGGHHDGVVDMREDLLELLLGVGLGFGGEVDLHLGLAVDQLVDGGDTVVAHLLLHGASGCGEHEVEGDLLAVHLDILDHSQLGETASEVGVVHMAQGHLDLCGCYHSAKSSFSFCSSCAPRKFRATTRPSRSTSTVAGIDMMP